MSAAELRCLAPRLCLAWEHQQVHERRRRRAEKKLQRSLHILAHRELQYLRSATTGNKRYVEHRERKLKAIRREVERLRREIEAA